MSNLYQRLKNNFFIMAGPNVIESEEHVLFMARTLKEIFDNFTLEEYGEMQSIALLRHLIHSSGLVAVKLDGYKLYDSGDPVSWLKSQIDHVINRKDVGEEMIKWMNDLLGREVK